MGMKIVWRRLPEPEDHKLILCAKIQYRHDAITPTGLRDEHLYPVEKWCSEHQCGFRISFDMFQFRTEADITAFLLVWG